MSRFSPVQACLPLALGIVLLTGCKGSVTLYPVSGQITLDEKPLADAQLAFVPDAEKGNKSTAIPFAKVEGGNYTLKTDNAAGAPAGWYKVMVQTQYPGGPDKPVVLPKKYTDPGKSGLSVEVVPSAKAGAYDFKMSTQVNAPN